jgi:hypothetical protein
MFLLKGVDYLQDDVLKVPRFLLTNLKHQLLQLYQRKLSIAVSDCMIGVALWSRDYKTKTIQPLCWPDYF